MELSLEEKLSAIDGQIRGIELQQYNVNLLILQEEALGNLERLDELNKEMDELEVKKQVMISEKNKLV